MEIISKVMASKEMPFAISSELMDTTNNIVVTVTSKNNDDIAKIKIWEGNRY